MVKKKPTKKEVSKFPKTKKLTAEELEEKFWDEVEVRNKDLIANLIERNLPISATPQNFDLEKDVDYRLLRDDITQSYYDNEEYQEKIANQNWTEEDVEYVAEEVALGYCHLVMKSLIRDLSDYSSYDPSFFSDLTADEY